MLKRYHAPAEAATFDLIPAIDLRDGRVVRLTQGDFRRETTYSDDPAAVAREFASTGVRRIHIVDLDGAREGRRVQSRAIAAIIAAARDLDSFGECQVAGGLRTEADVAAALNAGAARVVVGTAALADSGFAARLVATHGPERIVVALDVRGREAVGEGWRAGAQGFPVASAIAELADAGVTTFAVTAIARDGLLGGPDLDLLGELVAGGRGAIIASGGVASIGDLEAVRSTGCVGAIVGRAIYEGRFDLRAAVNAVTRPGPDTDGGEPRAGAGGRTQSRRGPTR